MNITVIGSGNGGQAMAGYLGMMGHKVVLYNRNIEKLKPIIENGEIWVSMIESRNETSHTY